MSITAVFSNTTLTQTWATSNKSDAYTSAEADGGSITRELGPVGTQSQQTVVYTCPAAIEKIHMGTWVTPAAPQNISVLANTNMVIGALAGYESAGTLNAYVAVKVSVVTESSNVLSFDRTLVDWTIIKVENVDHELGTVVGSSSPMGGYSANGLAAQLGITSADTIATGERVAIEVAIDKRANKTGTVAIEFGSDPDTIDDDTLTAGAIGTGPFSCSVLMPFALNEANQSAWGDHHHSEIEIPRVTGTNAIAWADIGSDWTAAKWETNPAAHYVSRSAGTITAQFWIFQDDDYLYVATNNIIDGCIQASDHHSVYICSDGNYENSLTTTTGDYLFRRDIVASTSFDGSDPTLPVAAGDGNDQGNYILKGGSTNTYPNSWEIPTWNTSTDTFSFSENGAEDWVEGVDYRMGGPGATATAPNGSAGAYSEFKIKKSRLNNWNGSDHLGIMINLSCDVQGNGNTLWPRLLGNQVDKDDWNFPGVNYLTTDGNTASSKSTAAPMDLRPLMSIHGHGPALANQASGTPSIPNITSTGSAKLGRKASGSPTIANITSTGSAKLGLTASGSPTIANITSTGAATVEGTVHYARGRVNPLVVDTFTDTNGTEIDAHTPDTDVQGGGWSDAAWNVTLPTADMVEIQGNKLVINTNDKGAVINTGTASKIVEVTWTTGTTGQDQLWLPMRYVNEDSNVSIGIRGNDQTVAVWDVPSWTDYPTGGQAITGGLTITNNTTYNVKVEEDGNRFRLWINDILQLDQTVTNLSGNTVAGVGIGTVGSPQTIDDYKVYALPDGPSIPNLTTTGNAQIQKWEYIGGGYSHNTVHPVSHTHGLTILEGDLVYAHVHLNSAQTGITPDQAGWTELYDDEPTGAVETTRIGVYWKVASASEPATYSWTAPTSSYWLVGIKVFRPKEAGTTPILERTTVAVYDGADSNLPVTADAGATVNANSLRIIAGMKDTRTTALEYTTADNGYSGVFGNGDHQITGLAHKEYSEGGTIEAVVTINTGDISDPVYSTSTVFNYATPSKTASGSPTIENITSTGAAKLGRKASGSPTIANVTTTGSATKVRTASGSPTIATVTSTGSATAKKIASGSPFIETLTTTGTATTRKVASGSPSIGNLSTTGTATAKKVASGSPFIETLTSTGSAAAYKVASGSPTIENLTSTGVATRTGTVDQTASGSPTLPNITAVGNSFIWPKVWLNASQTLSGATEMQVTSVSSDGTSITFTDPAGGPTGAGLWLGVENRANSDIGWIQVTVTDGAPLVVFGGFGA